MKKDRVYIDHIIEKDLPVLRSAVESMREEFDD